MRRVELLYLAKKQEFDFSFWSFLALIWILIWPIASKYSGYTQH